MVDKESWVCHWTAVDWTVMDRPTHFGQASYLRLTQMK